jgi:hypothetical protein
MTYNPDDPNEHYGLCRCGHPRSVHAEEAGPCNEQVMCADFVRGKYGVESCGCEIFTRSGRS